tara:strand:+ start:192 stop:392 length:201 start_codon:yes stop_codon:yes gene_type:complete
MNIEKLKFIRNILFISIGTIALYHAYLEFMLGQKILFPQSSIPLFLSIILLISVVKIRKLERAKND